MARVLAFITWILTCLWGCTEKVSPPPSLTLKLSIVSISDTLVNCVGVVAGPKQPEVLEKGILWTTDPGASSLDQKISGGAGLGEFSATLSPLAALQTYYARVYATTGDGILFGPITSFNTTHNDIPTMEIELIEFTEIAAKLTSTIKSGGVSTITSRGICWSTHSNPTIQDDVLEHFLEYDQLGKPILSSFLGNYTVVIGPLSLNTTYYVRSYVGDDLGVYYSNELSFRTQAFKYFNVSAGLDHSVAIDDKNKLWSWGNACCGVIGSTSVPADETYPGIITSFGKVLGPVLTGEEYAGASAGNGFTIAIKTDHSLYGWGVNWVGEAAYVLNRDQWGGGFAYLPVFVANGYEKIISGGFSSLSIEEDGGLVHFPGGIAIPMNGAVISMAAGQSHELAVTTDGKLWAWGDNHFGQLGNYSDGEYVPTPIEIGADFVSVGAGPYHSFGIKKDGTLWAWGLNDFGQLGDGTTSNVNYPILVGTGFSIVDGGGVALSRNSYPLPPDNSFSVGIKTDATIWVWGYNGDGQLGDGTRTDRLAPANVGSGFVKVSAGGSHVLAIKSDGTLWAWGSNKEGQLGHGALEDSLIPKRILH